MQCNPAFFGNGYNNGPFCSSFNTPIQATQGMYPEIVGEGQVTSVTLPDGSVQFFFMPTLKWWSPNAAQCHPFQSIPNPMFANNNYSIPPQYNNNGTWFIRSISNPIPQTAFNPPSQRNELPRLAFNTDFNNNLNSHDLGYQVKFHNDGGTSTTDLVYFYPSLRQRDFVIMPPCKDKTVQIDTGPVTNHTVCHYQVVCSKPCNCSFGVKPMSIENLMDPNLTSKSYKPCNCSVSAKPMSFETPVDHNLTPKSNKTCNCSVSVKPMSLELPVDPNLAPKSNKPCNFSVSAKPMSLETPVNANETSASNRPCNCSVCTKHTSLETPEDPNLTPKSNRPNNYSADATKPVSLEAPVEPNLTPKSNEPCKGSAEAKPMSLESLVDPSPKPKSNNTSTDDSSYSKEQNKRSKDKKTKIMCGCYSEDKKKKRNKSRNIICECDPKTEIVSVDKSITTYADESVSCNPADGRETQTNRTEDITSQCDVDTKPMSKSPLRTVWIDKGCNSDCSTCDERTYDDVSDKKYTRRDRGSKYKRSKPNKCDCGCCDCDSSVDCGTASEVETVVEKDERRETPYTCSTFSGAKVLEISKGSPIKIAQKASIGKANSTLQWLTPDNLSQKCELKDEEMTVPASACAAIPSGETDMDGKSPEKPLEHKSPECDTAADTCGADLCESIKKTV